MKNKLKYPNLIITATTIVALIAFAVYVLTGMYPDVLITAQDRNIYSGDSLFFSEQIARPFGLLQYVGAFMTQFFYYPALGASILIVIWVAISFVGIKAFRLQGMWRALMIVPVACLLASIVDLGYWIYCLNICGYWFSQSVGILCLLLLLWAANTTPRRFRMAWYVVVGFAAFPVFGWLSYLFTICLALSQFGKDGNRKTTPTWIDSTGIILAVVAPLIFRALLYRGILFEDITDAGFPFFKTSTNISMRPSIPFFILTGVTIFLSLGRILPAMKKVPASLSYLVVGVASAYGVWTSIFKDDNYIYEMQMTQASMNDDWKGVISIAEEAKQPSRTMVMLKNVALMNTGELGERSFELSNDGAEINSADTLDVNIMQIASGVVYYNYGKINYAMRWCMEFSVQYGFSPYHMKILARCAEITGEKELSKRYTERLNGLLFYRDWKPSPASPAVKELYSAFPDALDTDENSCERYLISILSRSNKEDSKLVSELAVFYSMILRDPGRFAYALYNYARLNKTEYIPREYEEAYCLFVDKNPGKFPYRIKISQETMERYKSFWDNGNRYAEYGYGEEGIKEALRDEYGDTYWWFNAFGRNMY